MLVLSRKAGEAIAIDGGIKVTVIAVHGKTVKIGVEAPDDVLIAGWFGHFTCGETRRISRSPKFIMARAAAPMFWPSVGITRMMTGGSDTGIAVSPPSRRHVTACR